MRLISPECGLSTPSPRLRGEGRGEGESPQGWWQRDSWRVPLTRNSSSAQISTSPRKRGEVQWAARQPGPNRKNLGRGSRLSPLAGRGRIALAIRVRGALRKGGRDGFKNARHISQHVVVPEAQNPVIVIGKPFVANRIARAVSMLTAVDFNNKAVLAANQVDCVRTDRLLSNKLVSIEATRSESVPKRGFRIRSFSPQAPGTSGLFLIGRTHADIPPHPDCFAIRPLPARGERLTVPVTE
jgi:hypothetical protein